MKIALLTFALVALAAAANPTNPSNGLVGLWKDADGQMRFNADGTGVDHGDPFRYEIRGSQITLAFEQATVTLQIEVRGDTLTLSGSGGTGNLTRVHEEAGPGRVRQEMVGEWRYFSFVNIAANNSRESIQTLTLNGDGRFKFSMSTDSVTPDASVTGGGGESGTWTATETSLTLHSPQKGTQVLSLEKRNHPKTGEAMLVLNGQNFTTTTIRPHW